MEILAPVTITGLDGVGKKKLVREIFKDNGQLVISDAASKIVLTLRPLTQNHQYIPGTVFGAIAVYDITNEESFRFAETTLMNMSDTYLLKMLVGTHRDLAKDRKISYEQATYVKDKFDGIWGEVGLRDYLNANQLVSRLKIRAMFAFKYFLEQKRPKFVQIYKTEAAQQTVPEYYKDQICYVVEHNTFDEKPYVNSILVQTDESSLNMEDNILSGSANNFGGPDARADAYTASYKQHNENESDLKAVSPPGPYRYLYYVYTVEPDGPEVDLTRNESPGYNRYVNQSVLLYPAMSTFEESKAVPTDQYERESLSTAHNLKPALEEHYQIGYYCFPQEEQTNYPKLPKQQRYLILSKSSPYIYNVLYTQESAFTTSAQDLKVSCADDLEFHPVQSRLVLKYAPHLVPGFRTDVQRVNVPNSQLKQMLALSELHSTRAQFVQARKERLEAQPPEIIKMPLQSMRPRRYRLAVYSVAQMDEGYSLTMSTAQYLLYSTLKKQSAIGAYGSPDIVLEIEIGDRVLKLPINLQDNAYYLAKEFAYKNGIGPEKVKQITNLILEKQYQYQARICQESISDMGSAVPKDIIFKVEVQIGDDVYSISVKEDDDLEALAQEFCDAMQIDVKYIYDVRSRLEDAYALWQQNTNKQRPRPTNRYHFYYEVMV